jgi:hypothetical protein
MHLTLKQTKALDILEDQTNGITELLFGGGAGGGKSQLGTYWLAKSALKYPGSRWLMARKDITTLKETTLVSFFDVANRQRISSQYTYRENLNEIRFKNGSVILLKELKHKPSDLNYDSLGSLEITGGFIDEIPQVRQKAWQVAKSRIRWKLDEFGLIPKLLGSCNPSKDWVYPYFYQPAKDGKLEPYKAFVQSLLTDNPHISKHYLDNLMTLDAASRQRLLLGNWEYDDDPTALMPYENLLALFSNSHVPANPKRYITADAARFGGDKIILFVWEGWRVIAMAEMAKQGTHVTAAAIRKLCQQYQVPPSNVVIDEDGVGGGVVDQVPGSKGFLNGSRPIKMAGQAQNYENLKTQCYYRLAELRINTKQLFITPGVMNPAQQQSLTEELGQIKSKDADKDGVLRIQPKDIQKLALGRSPDYADALMMREFFELASTYRGLL